MAIVVFCGLSIYLSNKNRANPGNPGNPAPAPTTGYSVVVDGSNDIL